MPETTTTLISANQLKTWSKCRRKYQLDFVHKLRWPSDPSNFRLGLAVHKLMDNQSRELPCDLLAQASEPDIRQAWLTLKDHPLSTCRIVASEWGFMVPVSGYWLQGRIDRISVDGEKALIIDWKTGTAIPKSPEADWQTTLYLYAATEARRELGLDDFEPEQFQFVYVEVKSDAVREVRVPYDRQRHQSAHQRIREALEQIQRESQYALPQKCPDRFCPYPSVCGINPV